jgi:hypothetical protein
LEAIVYGGIGYDLKHPKNSQQKMWRYVREDRLLDLLQTSELFFTQVAAFKDRLEGVLTRRTRDHAYRWFLHHDRSHDAARGSLAQYEATKAHFYANCWHMNEHESYLMWRAYAPERGYAIQTTFERLMAAFDVYPGPISGRVIDYVDFDREVTDWGNTFTMVSTKDITFRDEREFRLFFWRLQPHNNEQPVEENGTRIRVELTQVAARVFISPLIGEPPTHVQEALRQRGIPWESSAISLRSDQLTQPKHKQEDGENSVDAVSCFSEPSQGVA